MQSEYMKQELFSLTSKENDLGENIKMSSPPIEVVKDQNYNEIFSSSAMVHHTPTTICLIFNRDELVPQSNGQGIQKVLRKIQVAVYMSPQEAKSVGEMILKSITKLEETTKTKISIPENIDGKLYT